MKIGYYVAHEDDLLLAAAGTLIGQIESGEDVFVVVFADGRHSQKAVFGIERNPTPFEVAKKRREEFFNALDVLGFPRDRVYFLGQIDADGDRWKQALIVRQLVQLITENEMPDVVYCHGIDPHVDHAAVFEIMEEMLSSLTLKPLVYRFFLWIDELAREGIEYHKDVKTVIAGDIVETDIRNELPKKERAVRCMRSQVLQQPYPEWQEQPSAVLDERFLAYFFRGKELFVRSV